MVNLGIGDMNLFYKQLTNVGVVLLLMVPCILCHVIPVIASCPIGRYEAANGKCKLCFAYCGQEGCTGPGSFLGQGGCTSCWLAEENVSNRFQCVSPFHGCRSGFYFNSTESNWTHHIHTHAICRRCHPLCETCTGPNTTDCQVCKYFRLENYCVRECPPGSIIYSRQKRCTFLNESMRNRIMQTLQL